MQRPTPNAQRPTPSLKIALVCILALFVVAIYSIAPIASSVAERDSVEEMRSIAIPNASTATASPSKFLFDAEFDLRQEKDFKIDFGVEVHEKRKGRIVVTRPAGIEVSGIRTSCGCSAPSFRRVDEMTSEVFVDVKSARPSAVSSTLSVDLNDGSSRAIHIVGTFVLGITASPSIVSLDEDCSARVDLDWSNTKLSNPRVFCNDDRFSMEILEGGKSTTSFRLVAGDKVEKKDFALLTDLMFTLADSERAYEVWLPVRRSRSGVVVPSTMFVDTTTQREIKLFVVTDGLIATGQTGRCRLRQISSDFILDGEVVREKPSSLMVCFKLSTEASRLSGTNETLLEMEIETKDAIVWKEVGSVSLRFNSNDSGGQK